MAEGADIASGRSPQEEYARNLAGLVPPLDHRQALVEADRCYFCYDAPCVAACPIGIDIPSIRKIAKGNLEGSAIVVLSANIMGGTCARVSPTGCNLCMHVDPVEDCITMVEIDKGKPYANWGMHPDNPMRQDANG